MNLVNALAVLYCHSCYLLLLLINDYAHHRGHVVLRLVFELEL